MYTPFSLNREFDFVRIDGLRRATGRPPHEWDIYLLKELLDNALDADDTLWQQDHTHFPTIRIGVEYIPHSEKLKGQCLQISMSNRTLFPVEQIGDIFHTRWYTSRKAFLKGVTRGALGNALKTLLGIPYALRNKVASDWQPTLKPLSIRCGTLEYLPQYHVNEIKQQIHLTCETLERKAVHGTVIRLNVDNFQQEQPRTLEELQILAQQYHLCNPHAAFSWTVRLGEAHWTQEYQPDQQWKHKFQGIAPIHWYSRTAFEDVLAALYRQQNRDQEGLVPLESICRVFVSTEHINEITRACALEKAGLAIADIEGPIGNGLYHALLKQSPPFDPLQLGCIGREHLCAIISSNFDLDGEICYRSIASRDPDIPFVLEAAVALCKTGDRQIWTAMNFSPTYDDPFRNRKLFAPILADKPVFGLRGLLDAYGMGEETPALAFLHLICPNMKHQDYSKTEIDHLPFKEDLGKLLDNLLKELQQQQEEEALHLEETIHQILTTILAEVKTGERFILGQLLAQVEQRLQNHSHYAVWLKHIDAPGRIQNAVIQYLNINATLSQSIAQPPLGTLTIPLHPDRHFQLATPHLSQEILEKHSVNKILYIQERELETVAIENTWLCQMDMVLLHNPQDPTRLQEVVLHCLSQCQVPILVWHNANLTTLTLIENMRGWLVERHLDTKRLVDLGQHSAARQENPLLLMMPGEQVMWLRQQLHTLSLPIKAIPDPQKIRHDLSIYMEQLMLQYLLAHVKTDLVDLFHDLDQQMGMTAKLIEQQVEIEVNERLSQEGCLEAYETVIEQVARKHFSDMTQDKSTALEQVISHIRLTKQ